MTSPLDIKGTGDTLAIGRTVMNTRVNRLKETIAAIGCPHVNDRGEQIANSQSKLYLVDPLLCLLPEILESGLRVADMTQRSEAALAIALARSVEQLHPDRILDGRAIGYVRTGAGNEVDFAPLPIRVGGTNVTTTPLESKWVGGGWREEAKVIEGKFGSGIMATKNILDTSHLSWAVPAPIVAM